MTGTDFCVRLARPLPEVRKLAFLSSSGDHPDARDSESPKVVSPRPTRVESAPHDPVDARAEGTQVSLLGGFEVIDRGRPLPRSDGMAPQVIKIVATIGSVHVEQLIELLWSGVEPRVGRERLRTVLARMRRSYGELVVRTGDTLRLREGIAVDVELFDAEAGLALAGSASDEQAIASARAAVARYQGDLLPEDRYRDWTAAPRERLRRRFLALLDLLVDGADARGELRQAIGLMERAIEVEPYDEDRYLHAARLLLSAGRRGAAIMMLQRARAVVDELGLPPSSAQMELEREIQGNR